MKSGDAEIGDADLQTGRAVARLERTGACLQEAMRLWPTTAMLSRSKIGIARPNTREERIVGHFMADGVNIGFIKAFIKNGSKLQWPAGLQGEAFAKLREKIGFSLEEAIARARTNGRVDAATMIELNAARKGLDDLLDKLGGDLTMSEFMEAKRFLSYLGEGIRTLADHYEALLETADEQSRRAEAANRTKDSFLGTLSHELVHPYMEANFPDVPSWFNEGLAEYVQTQVTAKHAPNYAALGDRVQVADHAHADSPRCYQVWPCQLERTQGISSSVSPRRYFRADFPASPWAW